MARCPRPWFRSERSEWCVTIQGVHHRLGPHPDGFPAPRKQRGKWNAPSPILARFHELMAPHAISPVLGAPTVADVFEQFLDWCQKNRSARTYQWSHNHIQSFIDSLADKLLRVDELKPFQVQQWTDRKPTWGPNHKRGAIIAVQRAFSWAEKMGLILKSPIRHIEKPTPVRREQVLSPTEFHRVLTMVPDRPFRDVLEFGWETGARVQEIRLIEARHFKPGRGRLEIPPVESKGKKRWRVIYLTTRAEAIVQPLCASYPVGPVFRNRDGNAWTAQAFNCRFDRLKTKLGVKYALTAVRHSFATRMLEAGMDHLTVSALLGHADGAMLAKVYSHVGEKSDFLRDELLRVSGADTPG